MATARHQAIDRLCRDERLQRNLGHELRARQEAAVFDGPPGFDAAIDGDFVPDDLLRLMFVACHPVRRMHTHAR
jgi:predicted RNA polymerase sigma factor